MDPTALARRALDEAIALAGEPEFGIAPSEIGLTGLDTYFWLQSAPSPIEATASAGGMSVTAQATPTEYLWDFGDGNDLLTRHPGRAWTREQPGNIAHLYETRGTYELEVTVVWSARWRIGPGAWQPLGLFTTSSAADYPVRQVQSRLISD